MIVSYKKEQFFSQIVPYKKERREYLSSYFEESEFVSQGKSYLELVPISSGGKPNNQMKCC
jgi:hypothetical protein